MAASDPTEIDLDHPRFTADLTGQGTAEAALLAAWGGERMPHAWLITGPKGIGKATLAYRFARYVLAQGDQSDASGGLFGDELPKDDALSMAIDADHPVFGRIAAGAHGNLLTIERRPDAKTGKVSSNILIDNVRRIHGFFEHTAAEGGWRIAIVDSADEMNRNAANALLKTLEEPPSKSILILVAHRPGLLPATIRSRCRVLEMRPLPDDQVIAFLGRRAPELSAEDAMALAQLAEGSPGRALALAREGGLDIYRQMVGLLAALPSPPSGVVHSLASELAAVKAEARYRLFTSLLRDWLGRLVKSEATNTPPLVIDQRETAILARMKAASGLDRWMEVWEKMGELVERADALNLDRKQVILSLVFDLERATSR